MFSPVVGVDTVRTVIAVSAMQGCKVRALGFKQAYLNDKLSEDIRLELPDGEVVQACNAVCGLEQSGLDWENELRKKLTEGSWKRSDHDEYLSYSRADDGKIAALTTHADGALYLVHRERRK